MVNPDATLLVSVAELGVATRAMLDAFVLALPLILAGVLVLVLGLFVAKLVRRGAERSISRTARDPRAAHAWGVIVQYAVSLLALVAALAVAGVDLAALMVAVGVIGFALAFAMQETIANFISGLILLTSHPFGTGDAVEVGGEKGVVQEVGLRSTKIKSFDGVRIEVPNRSVLGSSISIYTHYRERRFDVVVGISYDDDITGAVDTALAAAGAVDGVHGDPPPEVLVDELAGSSVNLRVRFWCDSDTRAILETKAEVTQRVKEALDEAGYDIPFPIRTVFMHGANGESPGEVPGGDRSDERSTRAPGGPVSEPRGPER